ncbi:hypothetical protein FJ251_04870 [bacterium]|nr:hypothetical protein [bacterium]
MKTTRLCLAALLLAALAAAPPAVADITGSTIVKAEPSGPLALGQYVNLRLKVTNASTDFNWITRIDLRFPLCCTVAGMSYDDSPSNGHWVFDMFGVPGTDVSYIDGAGDEWGEIPGGDYGYLDLLVNVGEDCPSSERLWYDLYADGFGDPPHELLNRWTILTFDEVAVAGTSWSTVKSRY